MELAEGLMAGRDDIQRGESTSRAKLSAFTRKRNCEHEAYQPIGVRAQRRQQAAARMHSGLKPMRFVSLHHHTTFSFLDGFQMPDAHIRRATEINMGAVAFTEHGNIFSHVKAEKAAQAAGVKAIFGCEVYMGWTDEARRSQKKNHLTVLAKNAQGYANLLTLISRSWREGFYYEPTVDPRWLVEHKEGLIILSGCQGSALFTALVGGKHVEEKDASYQRGLRVARWFAERFDDYFVEVQAFPELEKTRQANPLLARIASEIRRPLVATMDVHYTAPEEAELQAVLHNVRPGTKQTLEEQVRDWGYEVPLCPPPTDKAIYRRLRATGLTKEQAVEAIVSTEEIAQDIDVELPRLPRVQFPLPDGYSSVTDLWRDWLREGWRYRGCHRFPKRKRERYKAQLKKEMEIIEAKQFENYFLIVSDSVKFAKGEQIPVGPARGSAAASLCCWLLRITEVDPMLFPNLVFERFIDWSREDLPDIDLDFATYGRPIVRDYLVSKYGEESVSNIGTFTMYKAKNSLDDAAHVHGIPKFKVETVKELLLERSSGDLRASATIEDTVDQFDEARAVFEEHPELRHSMDLEGNAKGFGVHAAGLVISNGPITEVAAVLEKEIKGNVIQVVSMDKYDAERQGLEKLDYLSLSTMDMIAEALRQLDMRVEDLYGIPLDDEEVIQGFRENDVVGIFQFDGRATRSVNGALKPDGFDEVVYVNALSRPGPLHNGAAQAYIDIKRGVQEPERIHPAYDRIVEATNFQIVFQEQILRIVREIGDFTWTHAAYIRKIISRKLGDAEFNRQWETFLKGALSIHERGDYPPMDEATAKLIWGMCTTAGSYAFNAAHSTSYGMLAYWTMWLKRKHPAIFYAASLAKMPEGQETPSRHDLLRRDAMKRDIAMLPPAPDHPQVSWQALDDMTMRAGLADLPGFGEKTAEKIIEFFSMPRPISVDGKVELAVRPPATWADYQAVPGIGPKKIEQLEAFGQARDPFRVHELDEALESVREAISGGLRGSDGTPLPEPTHRALDVPYESGQDTAVVFLGMPVHRNLRDIFEANRRRGEELDPEKVKRPDLNEWVMLLATDGDEQVTLRINRWTYPKFRDMIWKIKLGEELVLVKGVKPGYRSAREIQVSNMWVIEP
jgi:DNA polymerase III subunit alpha